MDRKQVLDANKAIQSGQAPAARRLDEGYVALRIPEDDWPLLIRLDPELISTDHAVRLAAWKRLEASPLGDAYRTTERSPLRVQRAARHGNQGIIVK